MDGTERVVAKATERNVATTTEARVRWGDRI
jgi:hypothetical protein